MLPLLKDKNKPNTDDIYEPKNKIKHFLRGN